MVPIITPTDVATFTAGMSEADVKVLVDGLNSKTIRIAPCLGESPTNDALAEARLILVGAIKRWSESGSGAFSQLTSGPFTSSVDTRRSQSGYNLWPSEINALQDLCADDEVHDDEAFMVDMIKAPDSDDLRNRPDLRFQYGWPPHWVAGTDIEPRTGGGVL